MRNSNEDEKLLLPGSIFDLDFTFTPIASETEADAHEEEEDRIVLPGSIFEPSFKSLNDTQNQTTIEQSSSSNKTVATETTTSLNETLD